MLLHFALVFFLTLGHAGVIVKPPKNACKEYEEALAAEYGTVFGIPKNAFTPTRIAHDPFGKNATRFAEVFEPSLKSIVGQRPDAANYERRMREFAQEVGDNRSVSESLIDLNGNKTHIKMNTATGELLVTTSKNEVGAYMRIPVTKRSFGKFKTAAEVFEDLTNWVTVPTPDGKSKVWPRLTAGESIVTKGFSPEKLWPHVEKHVLKKFSNETRESFLSDMEDPKLKLFRSTEFPKMREEYLNSKEKSDIALAEKYNQAAIDLCKSDAPNLLTITRIQNLKNGSRTVVSYRFNPLTNEFVVIDRMTNNILTYYVVNSDMRKSNMQLDFNWKLPPVKTPTEYFLVMGTRPIDSEEY